MSDKHAAVEVCESLLRGDVSTNPEETLSWRTERVLLEAQEAAGHATDGRFDRTDYRKLIVRLVGVIECLFASMESMRREQDELAARLRRTPRR